LSQWCFQKGVACIKAASTNNSMSSQKRQNVSSSAGRGRPLHPTATVHAHSAGVGGAAAPPHIPLAAPAPRPQVAHQIIQQIQQFLVQLAWQEVSAGVTTTIADQKTKLLEAFQRYVVLFLNNSIPATNASFPSCPDALRNADRTAAVQMLNQSTGSGKASLTKESLYRKAKKGVQKLLKYMGDWVRVCKDPNTRDGQFIPAQPPSGQDRDWVWNKIKSTEHRCIQCLKIWKSRSENRHLVENTDAAVQEALIHLNFARRGMSLDEEMAFRGMHENGDLDEEQVGLYSQIMQEVASGQVLVDSDDDEAAPATSNANVSRVSTSAPRGYFEQPYCEMSGIYHPFELAFKAFSQYAGNGHEEIAGFYTSEWADLRRTQASSGGHGRTHQRDQHHADQTSSRAQANSSQSQDNSGLHQQPSQVTAVSSQSMNQLHDIAAQMEHANSRGRHTCMMSTFEKAIELSGKLNKPVEKLQTSYLEYLMAEIDRQLPASAAAGTAPTSLLPSLPTAIATTPRMVPLAPLTPSTPQTAEPPPQRRRLYSSDTSGALEQIKEVGEIIENRGKGNCLFHCLAHVEDEYLTALGRRPRDNSTHENMRAQVVATLRDEADVIRVAVVRDVRPGELHSIYAAGDMVQQKVSVEVYCDWMAQDGSCGRSVTPTGTSE
jgi:hypothetical protein